MVTHALRPAAQKGRERLVGRHGCVVGIAWSSPKSRPPEVQRRVSSYSRRICAGLASSKPRWEETGGISDKHGRLPWPQAYVMAVKGSLPEGATAVPQNRRRPNIRRCLPPRPSRSTPDPWLPDLLSALGQARERSPRTAKDGRRHEQSELLGANAPFSLACRRESEQSRSCHGGRGA